MFIAIARNVLPPVWLLISILLMVAAHIIFPWRAQLFPLPVNYAGIALLIMGVVISLPASNLFEKFNTTIKPFTESSYLVTEGIFQYSRNPMYLGMLAILVGLWLFLGSLTPVIMVAAFYWIISQFVAAEEKMLEEKFGPEYVAYKERVRRWL